MKSYLEAVDAYKANPTPEALEAVNAKQSLAYSKIDRAVKRGVLHGNTGARRKTKLAVALKKVTATN